MKNLTLITLAIFLIYACKSDIKNADEKINTLEVESNTDQLKTQKFTHLKDTIKIKGNTILILRPDSLRFHSYLNSGKEWIYEVDSDFGFGFSTALESINYNGVYEDVTDKRFVIIYDCKGCPLLIDRDTIDYGFILTKRKGVIKIDNKIFPSEYYIDQFEKYFNE